MYIYIYIYIHTYIHTLFNNSRETFGPPVLHVQRGTGVQLQGCAEAGSCQAQTAHRPKLGRLGV